MLNSELYINSTYYQAYHKNQWNYVSFFPYPT